MANVYDWFEERLEIQALAEDVTSKYVPPHVNIFYCWWNYFNVFPHQFATGLHDILLQTNGRRSDTSVQHIMNEVNFGWLIRSIHRWSASMMVLMMILHTFRVYLTGGFKKPS
jgi:cytochrome b6